MDPEFVAYLPHAISALGVLLSLVAIFNKRDHDTIKQLWEWYQLERQRNENERRDTHDCHEDLHRVRSELARHGIHVHLRSVPPRDPSGSHVVPAE